MKMRWIILGAIMVMLVSVFVIGDEVCTVKDFFENYSEIFKAGNLSSYNCSCILQDKEKLLNYKYGYGNLWSQCIELENVKAGKSVVANKENESVENKTETIDKIIENITKAIEDVKANKTSDNETISELENRLKNFPKLKLPPNSGLALLGLSPTVLMIVLLMLLLKLGKKRKKKKRR